jgi:purine-binding chemotaxis protein CheW
MGEKSDTNAETDCTEYVTVMLGEQLFGLPISRVQDVFVPDRLTRVPLAPPEVAGILNLRGRVVTAIDMRSRLDLGRREEARAAMAIGVEFRSESYGLLVDSVGEVMKFPNSQCEAKPANLGGRMAQVASGIFRLENQLMVVLDVDRILDMKNGAMAA